MNGVERSRGLWNRHSGSPYREVPLMTSGLRPLEPEDEMKLTLMHIAPKFIIIIALGFVVHLSGAILFFPPGIPPTLMMMMVVGGRVIQQHRYIKRLRKQGYDLSRFLS